MNFSESLKKIQTLEKYIMADIPKRTNIWLYI